MLVLLIWWNYVSTCFYEIIKSLNAQIKMVTQLHNFRGYIQFAIKRYAFNIIKIYQIVTSCIMAIKWLSGNYTFIHVYLHLKRSG